MSKNLTNVLLAATFAISTATTASHIPTQPSLIGDTVNCSIAPPPSGPPVWACTTPSAVVGAGRDFEIDFSLAPASFGFDVNIGPSAIRIFSNEDNTFGVGNPL